jgi:hypothetical protein
MSVDNGMRESAANSADGLVLDGHHMNGCPFPVGHQISKSSAEAIMVKHAKLATRQTDVDASSSHHKFCHDIFLAQSGARHRHTLLERRMHNSRGDVDGQSDYDHEIDQVRQCLFIFLILMADVRNLWFVVAVLGTGKQTTSDGSRSN